MTKIKLYKDLFKFLISISILFSFSIHAENGEWEWFISFNPTEVEETSPASGVAENMASAEEKIKSACKFCDRAKANAPTLSNGKITYTYNADPRDSPAIYGPWESNLEARRELFANIYPSSPECEPTTVTETSSWLDDDHYTPSISEKKSLNVVTNYYSHSEEQCNEYIRETDAQRSREALCEEYSFNALAGEVDGQATHFCRITIIAHVRGPVSDNGCDKIGNPCNISTGDKIEVITDISIATLSFKRSYSSLFNFSTGIIGAGWRHNFDDSLIMKNQNSGLYLSRSGHHMSINYSHTDSNGQIIFDVKPAFQNRRNEYQLIKTSDSFQMIFPMGNKRIFDLDGKLIRVVTAAGLKTSLNYQNGKLVSVADHFGNFLSFEYNSNRISRVESSGGGSATYHYNTVGNLVEVTYEINQANHSSIIYHYEDSRFPHHLTGITDENGDRFGIYTYDSTGKAIATEHAETTNNIGQEKFELDFQ